MEREELLVQQTPIAGLPVEILTNIINAIADDPTYNRWGQYLPDDSIAISHVCRFWREVALGPGTKMLWTFVPLRHNADCVRNFIKRSHPLLVDLKIEFGDVVMRTSLTALAEAVTYMDRVGKLSFKSLYDEDFSEDEDALHTDFYDLVSSNAAPSLTEMTWYIAHTLEDDAHELPSRLFAEQVPLKLRYLKVVGVEIPPAHALLRGNLTVIEIENCIGWETVDQLLDILSGMHNLECFVFNSESHTAVGDGLPSGTYAARSIDLPLLDILSLTDAQPGVPGIILTYLRIPVDARIHIGITFEEAEEDDAMMLQDALEAHYHANTLPDGELFVFSEIAMGICGQNENGITVQALYNYMTRLSLVFGEGWPLNSASRAMLMETVHSVFEIPVLAHATQLNISHSNFFATGRSADWLALRACAPNLSTIVVSRTAFHGLSAVLFETPDTQWGVLFPKLSNLCFEGIPFEEDPSMTAFCLVALVRLARHRLRQGHPVKRIEFRKCSGAKKLSEQLAAVLPSIRVVYCELGIQGRVVVEKEAARWDIGDWDLGGLGY